MFLMGVEGAGPHDCCCDSNVEPLWIGPPFHLGRAEWLVQMTVWLAGTALTRRFQTQLRAAPFAWVVYVEVMENLSQPDIGLLQKFVAGSNERRTRLQDRRGRVVPLGELTRLPLLLVERFRKSYVLPWMARGAVEQLASTLNSDMTLLEFGSGVSTAWFAARVGHVICLEPDVTWAAYTKQAVSGRNNVELRIGMIADLAPLALADDKIDVVIVDHNDEPSFSRLDALRLLGSRVTVAVLDDSDRSEYRGSNGIMVGWRAQQFVSFKSRPLAPTETTIYTRTSSPTFRPRQPRC